MPYNWDAPIKIRDLRNGEWFWVHKYVWKDKKLKSSDKVVYGTLAYFANNQSQDCYPSLNTMVKFSGLSKPTVTASLRRLTECNYIKKKKDANFHKGKANVYTLVKNFNQPSKEYAQPSKKDYLPLGKKTTPNNTYITRLNNNKGKALLKDKLDNLGLKRMVG